MNFASKMQKGVTECSRTLAVPSPHFLESRFTRAEWTSAFAQDPDGEHGLLITVRVAECGPLGLLHPRIYIDLIGLSEKEARQKLVDGVKGGRVKPASAPPFPGSSRTSPMFPGAIHKSTSSDRQPVNFELYNRRLRIYNAARRLIEYVVQKGNCSFEELDRFSRDTQEARFLFNEESESYLRKLHQEALTLPLGEIKRSALDPASDEHRKSRSVYGDRIMWFNEQVSEVKRLFDPFLRVQDA